MEDTDYNNDYNDYNDYNEYNDNNNYDGTYVPRQKLNKYLYIQSWSTQGSGPLAYTLYHLKGTLLSSEIKRRYSDFFLLREKLIQRWPCIFIPSLPSKKIIGKMSSSFIETRMAMLNHFLNKLSKIQDVFNSDEIKAFIAQGDIKSSLNSLTPVTYATISSKYESSFHGYDKERYNSEEGIKKLETFYRILKKGKENMEKIEIGLSNEITHIENEKQYTKETLLTLSKCEMLFPENFGIVSQTIVDDITGKVNGQTNPFKDFYHFILGMKADMKSFMEAYETLLKYKSKETEIGNKIQTMTQQNGDANKIAALNQDLPCVQSIINASAYRLEIDCEQFKKDQIYNYNEELFQLKEVILVFEQVMEKIWNAMTITEYRFG